MGKGLFPPRLTIPAVVSATGAGQKPPRAAPGAAVEVQSWRESPASCPGRDMGTGKSGLFFEQADENTVGCNL